MPTRFLQSMTVTFAERSAANALAACGLAIGLVISGGINPAAADSVSIGVVSANERTGPAATPPQDVAAPPTGQHLLLPVATVSAGPPAIARWPKRRRAAQVFREKSPTP
jgi:hypothetical protein